MYTIGSCVIFIGCLSFQIIVCIWPQGQMIQSCNIAWKEKTRKQHFPFIIGMIHAQELILSDSATQMLINWRLHSNLSSTF